MIPQTKEGIIGYLGSGLIKGIGPKIAAAIYGTFGLQTMEVLENRPEELLRIRGISPQKLEKIRLFKNGRIDIRFTNESYAREFVSSYLGTVW